MGGQACVFYGGAEFSRDTDLAVLAETENLGRLQCALEELQAVAIAIPPFDAVYLEKGHAVHFRCRHPDAHRLRIDIMSTLRGVAPFPELWSRRTTFTTENGEVYDVLSLPDLVQAKKTQRDKDWLMLRRLMEAHYFQRVETPTKKEVVFWFRELRTAGLLLEAGQIHPGLLEETLPMRSLLKQVIRREEAELACALTAEENRERELDRTYWKPLKQELATLRQQRLEKD